MRCGGFHHMDNRRKIPVPPKVVMSEVGTQKDKQSAPLVERVQAMRLMRRQIRASQGWVVMRREV